MLVLFSLLILAQKDTMQASYVTDFVPTHIKKSIIPQSTVSKKTSAPVLWGLLLYVSINMQTQQQLETWALLRTTNIFSHTKTYSHAHNRREWEKCSYANAVRKQKNRLVVSDRWSSSRDKLLRWAERRFGGTGISHPRHTEVTLWKQRTCFW